jgi:hypothetical protein
MRRRGRAALHSWRERIALDEPPLYRDRPSKARLGLIGALAALRRVRLFFKSAQRQARAKLAEFEAVEAKRNAYCEAYERIPEEERRAYERGRRLRSDAWRYKDEPMPPTPWEYAREGHEPELAAYVAGVRGEPIPGLEVKNSQRA